MTHRSGGRVDAKVLLAATDGGAQVTRSRAALTG